MNIIDKVFSISVLHTISTADSAVVLKQKLGTENPDFFSISYPSVPTKC